MVKVLEGEQREKGEVVDTDRSQTSGIRARVASNRIWLWALDHGIGEKIDRAAQRTNFRLPLTGKDAFAYPVA